MFGLFKKPKPEMGRQAQEGIRKVGRSILASASCKETAADVAHLQLAAERWIESMLPYMPEDFRGEMRHVLNEAERILKSA
jgi:hypothetical protein